jgi:DNA-binding PadR family transcriptional regulator
MSLRSVEFHILLALAGEERHGYAILQEVARLTEGELRLEPGTLYRALHRMLKDGWLAEGERRAADSGNGLPGAAADNSSPAENARRKYYRLTPSGRTLAAAEADRLWRLVAVAREHRLLSRA